jgi:hypothetical protein
VQIEKKGANDESKEEAGSRFDKLRVNRGSLGEPVRTYAIIMCGNIRLIWKIEF